MSDAQRTELRGCAAAILTNGAMSMDNHLEENKPAVAKSRAEGANSNVELAGWVSVQKRLPIKTGPYACATTRHEYWEKAWFDVKRQRWEGETLTMMVTHWFEVPDLPAN